jgi:hypothetical protein
MSIVTVEPELAAQLTRNGEDVSLADRDGKLLGHLVSPRDYEAFKAWRKATAWMYEEPTAEELRRSFEKGGRHTMEEVFKLLEE